MESQYFICLSVIVLRICITFSRSEFFRPVGDAIGHLSLCNTNKKNVLYPSGYHKFVKCVFGNKIKDLPGLPNLSIYTLFIIITYLFFNQNMYFAIYASASSLLIDEYNGHQFTLSERLLGQICCGCALASVIFGYPELVIIFYVIIIYSSLFGRQFSLFILFPSLLVCGSYIVLLKLLTITCLLFIIDEKLKKSLQWHVLWVKGYNKVSTIQIKKKFRPVYEFHLFRILMFPEIFILFLTNKGIFLVVFSVFILSSFRRFTAVGESWRYIEWSTFVFTCFSIDGAYGYLIACKVLGFYFYRAVHMIILGKKDNNDFCVSDAREVIDRVGSGKIVFPVPYRTGDELLCVNNNIKLAAWWPIAGIGSFTVGSQYHDKYIKRSDYTVINKKTTVPSTSSHYINKVGGNIILENEGYMLIKNA